MDKVKGEWKVPRPKRDPSANLQVKDIISYFFSPPLLWKAEVLGCDILKELLWRNQHFSEIASRRPDCGTAKVRGIP